MLHLIRSSKMGLEKGSIALTNKDLADAGSGLELSAAMGNGEVAIKELNFSGSGTSFH